MFAGNRHIYWGALLLLELFYFVELVSAQELDANNELERIQIEVQNHSTNLEILTREQKKFESELRRLEAEISQVKSEQKRFSGELDQTNREIKQTEEEVVKLEKQMIGLEALSRQRIRAAYMVRPGRILLGSVVGKDDIVDLGKQAYLLALVRKFDLKLLKQRRSLVEEKQKGKELLESAAKRQRILVNQVAAKQRAVRDKVIRQKSVVNSIAQKKTEVQRSLVVLRAQALRIETVMRSLTSGQTVDHETVSPQIKAVAPTSFSGNGLAGRKDELSPPVAGKVLKGFGKRGDDFSRMVASKGLEFETGLESPVFAVAEGRILHVGKMPGYGLVLIVDHGDRYYSIYGRLSRVDVQVGQDVALAQEIAKTSAVADDGRTFYLEIRKDGNPQDPQQYFQNRL